MRRVKAGACVAWIAVVRRFVLLPFLMLVLAARPARAEDSAAGEQERRTFFFRMAGSAGLIEGSRLVGHGSRERFTQPSFAVFDLRLTRIFWKSRFGIDLSTILMIPGNADTKLGYGLFEVAGDVVIAQGEWGVLMAGAGGGGDFGRYWWDGRGYPLVFVRDRMNLSRKVHFEIESRTIPIALDAKLLPMFEQRFEIAMGIGLFTCGMRFNWTVLRGGQPERAYQQHELTGFVGLGL